MHAILSADNIGKEAWDPVIATCCIIVKVDEGFPGESCNFIFQFSQEHTKNQIEVCLVEEDRAKLFHVEVTAFLF